LREWVLERFQGDLITEPKYVPAIGKFVGSRYLQESGAFVAVFMRPQTMVGSAPSQTMPVHYNIAKADIVAFQRKAETQIDQAQQHAELFRATMSALRGLLSKGKLETDYINVLLPHAYDAFEEVEGVMCEVERPLLPLGRTGGLNTVIIVDTSGPLGRQLTYVRAALKRALHAQMNTKTSFQLIRFMPGSGEPRLWSKSMTPPTDEAIQAAEDWIDNLLPAQGGQLLTAIHYALAHNDCDEIYIVSAGNTDVSQHDQILRDIRGLNTREVPIHCVGVNPEPMGELLLRNISESNHGDFCSKAFSSGGGDAIRDAAGSISSQDARWTSWRTNLVNEKSKELCDSFKKQRMSIGGQIRIIEVMQREESQKEDGWHHEWQCAQRLLLSQENDKTNALTRDSVRELQRKNSRTLSARVGGGFAYCIGERDLGLESLFEHKSATPWTDATDTNAAGPRLPMWDAGQGRLPRMPLDPEPFPTHAAPGGSCFPSFPTASEQPRLPPRPRSSGGVMPGTASRDKLPAIFPFKPHQAPQTFGPAGTNPWGEGGGGSVMSSGPPSSRTAERTKRPSSASRRGRGGANTRTASADRAAGGGSRPTSPAHRGASKSKGRSKTPPPGTDRTRHVTKTPRSGPNHAASTLLPDSTLLGLGTPSAQPSLERRWSF